jgi:hypothetical protein
VVVSVVHTNGVYLLFVTLDAVRGTDVISEQPGLSGLAVPVKDTASKQRRGYRLQVTMNGVVIFHLYII